MIYYTHRQACLIYLKANKMAYLAIDGYISSQALRDVLIETYNLCKKFNLTKVLADSSGLAVIKIADVEYIKQHILPLLDSLNSLYIAFVKPVNIFGQASLKIFNPQNSNHNYNTFETLEHAENWLKNDVGYTLLKTA